jgi:hypothetical protein
MESVKVFLLCLVAAAYSWLVICMIRTNGVFPASGEDHLSFIQQWGVTGLLAAPVVMAIVELVRSW